MNSNMNLIQIKLYFTHIINYLKLVILKIYMSRAVKYLLTSIILFVIAFFVILFYTDISSFFFKNNPSNGELLKIILSCIGGTIAIIALRINYKRTEAFKDNVETQNKQFELNIRYRVDDQFNDAHQSLGHNKEVVVIGAIKILLDIANRYPKDYKSFTCKLLTVFLKEEANISIKTDKIRYRIVDFIIEVLTTSDIFNDERIDLKKINLSRLTWGGKELENIDFGYSLMPTNIQNCHFINCSLTGSLFISEDIEDFKSYVDLNYMNDSRMGTLSNIIFEDCNLKSIIFSRFSLTNMSLIGFSSLMFSYFNRCIINDGNAMVYRNCDFLMCAIQNSIFLYQSSIISCEVLLRTKSDFFKSKIINTNISGISLLDFKKDSENKFIGCSDVLFYSPFAKLVNSSLIKTLQERRNLLNLKGNSLNYNKFLDLDKGQIKSSIDYYNNTFQLMVGRLNI